MIRNCNYCKAEYSRRPSVIGQYCSNVCKGKGNLAQQKNLTYRIAQGSTPWNKGKGWVKLNCPNCRKPNRVLKSQSKGFCNTSCANQYQTHRIPQTYGTLHKRIRDTHGTPKLCENCGDTTSTKFEWANISGEYRLERRDWARLCCKCHRRYDFGTKNRIEVLNV